MNTQQEDESTIAGDESVERLVSSLRQLVSTPPLSRTQQQKRALNINLLLEGISAKGIDAPALLRFGLADHLWQPLFILLIATPKEDRAGQAAVIDFEAWYAALSIEPLAPEDFMQVESTEESSIELTITIDSDFSRPFLLLRRWAHTAPLNEVLAMAAPDADFFERVPVGDPEPEVKSPYLWLVQRYAEPDLADWNMTSLQLEYRHRHTEWVPSFGPDVVAALSLRDDQLNAELARRAASVDAEADNSHDVNLMTELKRQAIGFLDESRYLEAAALFEFYSRRNPANLEAKNNLAFCLLPLDPESALFHLDALGRSSGFLPRTMLAYNQCLAMLVLGRADEALTRAEHFWQREREHSPGGAFLWRRKGDTLELYNEDNVTGALAGLAVEIADSLGRGDRKARWEERLQSV